MYNRVIGNVNSEQLVLVKRLFQISVAHFDQNRTIKY